MKPKHFILNTAISIIVFIAGTIAYQYSFHQKTAYIDIKKVFNGFTLKKELEEKFKTTEKKRAQILDSMSFNLRIIAKQINESKDKELIARFEIKRGEFLNLKGKFEEENRALSNKYDAQILEQLTQYTIDYGKINKYDFIYGADGNGNIMYSNDKFDLTNDVLTYINNKYKGAE